MNRSTAIASATLALATLSPLSGAVLFQDGFDNSGAITDDINLNLGARQFGTAATAPYLDSGSAPYSKLTDTGELELFYSIPPNHIRWVTLDHDFTTSQAYQIDVELAPSMVPDAATNTFLHCGITIGLPTNATSPLPFETDGVERVSFHLQNARNTYIGAAAPSVDIANMMQHTSLYQVWQGADVPDQAASQIIDGGTTYQNTAFPNAFSPAIGAPYHLRIIGVPISGGTLLRFFFEDMSYEVARLEMPGTFSPGYISLYAYQNGGNFNDTFTVKVDNLSVQEISSSEALKTFTYDDTVFANYLNLDHPDLAAVKAAYDADDIAGARSALAAHIATRPGPLGPPLPDRFATDSYIEVADNTLSELYGFGGHYSNFKQVPYPAWQQWQNGYYPTGFGYDFDGGNNNGENAWLNRFMHFNSLAKAYKETGNEVYAQRYAQEISDWIDGEPFLFTKPTNWAFGTRYVANYSYTGDRGRRIQYGWGNAYESFRASPSLDADTQLAIVKSYRDHYRTQANPSAFLPWDDSGIQMTYGMLVESHLFPEWKDSDELKQHALDRFQYCLDQQFYPDGSHKSCGSGYYFGSVDSILLAVDFFQRNGWDVPQTWMDMLDGAIDSVIFYTRPGWGNMPVHNGGRGPDSDKSALVYAELSHRDDLLWHSTQGAQGTPPDFTSQYKPYLGQFMLRTGWGDEERALFFDAGPSGASHGWDDKLSIIFSRGGKMLLERGYEKIDSTSFSTVLFDGLGQRRVQRLQERVEDPFDDRRFITNDWFDYAEGFHSQGWSNGIVSHEGFHTRQIVGVKKPGEAHEAFYLVFDTIDPEDGGTHTYEANWWLSTTPPFYEAHSNTILVTDPAGDLNLVPLNPRDVTVDNSRRGGRSPAFAWEATGTTTRAWALIAKDPDEPFPIDTVVPLAVDRPGDIAALLTTHDGNAYIVSRTAGDDSMRLGQRMMDSEVSVVTFDPDGNVARSLELEVPNHGNPAISSPTITASTGNAYDIVPWGLKSGVAAWNGFGHTVNSVSAGLLGRSFIRTHGSDSAVSDPQHLELALDRMTCVTLLFRSGSTLPSWFESEKWEATGETVVVDISSVLTTFNAYQRYYPAGTFFFGGNDSAETGETFNYLMALEQEDYAVAASTGNTYDILPGGATVGSTIWNDRSYTFSALDPRLAGGDLVRCWVADEFISNPEHLFLSIDRQRDVFLALRPGSSLPSWLDTDVWKPVSDYSIQTSLDGALNYEVFRANLKPGVHVLGGQNWTETGVAGNYLLILPQLNYGVETFTSNQHTLEPGAAALGLEVWHGRDYVISQLSDSLVGADFVKTTHDDEFLVTDEHIRLTLDRPSLMTIALWPESEHPSWFDLNEWRASNERLWVDVLGEDNKFELYTRIVPAGTYVFGGNDRAATDSIGHYLMLVRPDHVAARWVHGKEASLALGPAVGGTANISPSAESYLAGNSVTLTPVSETGYRFEQWTGSVTGSEDPVSITLSGDAVVTPNFTPDLSTFTGYMIDATGSSGPLGNDTDLDGMLDGFEFIYGTNANLAEGSGLPRDGSDGSHLRLEFPLNPEAEGYTLTPKWAYDLDGPWSTGGTMNARPDLGPDWMEAVVPFEADEDQMFLRLELELDPPAQ